MKPSPLRLLTLSALSFLLLATVPATAGESFTGKVVAVSDGDTLVVRKKGMNTVVQIAGIDAPELGQEYGAEARDYLHERLRGKKVSVEVLEWKSKRSSVGRLSLDGTDIGVDLVSQGFAWTIDDHQYDELKAAAKAAKSSKEGLWSSTKPTTPWGYRASKGGR